MKALSSIYCRMDSLLGCLNLKCLEPRLDSRAELLSGLGWFRYLYAGKSTSEDYAHPLNYVFPRMHESKLRQPWSITAHLYRVPTRICTNELSLAAHLLMCFIFEISNSLLMHSLGLVMSNSSFVTGSYLINANFISRFNRFPAMVSLSGNDRT